MILPDLGFDLRNDERVRVKEFIRAGESLTFTLRRRPAPSRAGRDTDFDLATHDTIFVAFTYIRDQNSAKHGTPRPPTYL